MREIDSTTPVVIMSGHATIETAVKATKLGAFEVLEKPLELERILDLIAQVQSLRKTPASGQAKSDLDLVGDSTFRTADAKANFGRWPEKRLGIDLQVRMVPAKKS